MHVNVSDVLNMPGYSALSQTTPFHSLKMAILPNDSPCSDKDDQTTYRDFESYSLIISSCIILILCVLERRSENSVLKKCGRRPGLIFPVNMLDHGCDNFGYAMAFGSVTSHCFQLFTSSTFTEGPAWSRTLYIMMYVLVIGLMFYPLFACLSTSWVFVGSILGLLYTSLWLFINFNIVIRCPTGEEGSAEGQNVAVRLPVLICLMGLFVKYAFSLIRQAVRATRARTPRSLLEVERRHRLGSQYNVKYVQNLLLARCGSSGPAIDFDTLETPVWHRRLRVLLRRHLYMNDPTFKYSPRIVCIFTVSLICAYQFGIIILLLVYQLMKIVPQLYPNTTTPGTGPAQVSRSLDDLRLLLNTIEGCTLFAFGMSTVITLFSIFQILTNYRKNIKLMYKGLYQHLPFKRTDRLPNFVLSDSLSYSGSQIAYILWGFLVVFTLLFATCMALVYLLVYPIFNIISRDVLKYVLLNFVPGILILQLVYWLQRGFSWGLLQSRHSVNSKGKTVSTAVLALDNRKVYHNVSYFLFFFYIVLGLFGCFLTIVKGVILGVLYLARLDRCGLVPGFETWDTAYMYYVSFLHLEVSHRHPVLLVFCDILLDAVPHKREWSLTAYGAVSDTNNRSRMDESLIGDEENDTSITRSNLVVKCKRLARNRWLKAYTLVRNPKVRPAPVEKEYELLESDDSALESHDNEIIA